MDTELLSIFLKYGARLSLYTLAIITFIRGCSLHDKYQHTHVKTDQGITNKMLGMMSSAFLLGSSLIALAILHVGGYQL